MDYSAEIGTSVLHADHPGIDGLMPISIKHDFHPFWSPFVRV